MAPSHEVQLVACTSHRTLVMDKPVWERTRCAGQEFVDRKFSGSDLSLERERIQCPRR